MVYSANASQAIALRITGDEQPSRNQRKCAGFSKTESQARPLAKLKDAVNKLGFSSIEACAGRTLVNEAYHFSVQYGGINAIGFNHLRSSMGMGRLLQNRRPYEADMLEVVKICVNKGVAVEINGDPYRMDLDWCWDRSASNWAEYSQSIPTRMAGRSSVI